MSDTLETVILLKLMAKLNSACEDHHRGYPSLGTMLAMEQFVASVKAELGITLDCSVQQVDEDTFSFSFIGRTRRDVSRWTDLLLASGVRN